MSNLPEKENLALPTTAAGAQRNMVFIFGVAAGGITSLCLAAVIILVILFSNFTQTNSDRIAGIEGRQAIVSCKQAKQITRYPLPVINAYKESCKESKAAIKKYGGTYSGKTK